MKMPAKIVIALVLVGVIAFLAKNYIPKSAIKSLARTSSSTSAAPSGEVLFTMSGFLFPQLLPVQPNVRQYNHNQRPHFGAKNAMNWTEQKFPQSIKHSMSPPE
jgi:hypothetical protein